MYYTRRILPRRPEDGALLQPDGDEEALPRAPRAAALSPVQVLALQRSGVGNRLLARVLDGKDGDEDEVEEEPGGGGYPLLLTDRPWEVIERERALRNAPIRQGPQFALELPIVLPAESLPPGMRAMFGLDQPVAPTVEPPEAPDIDEVEAAPEPEKTETEAETTEPEAEPEQTEAEPQAAKKKRRRGKKGPAQQAAPPPAPAKKALHEMSVDEVLAEMSGGGKKETGKKSGGTKKQQQPQQKKKSPAQKAHEKEQAAKRAAQQAKEEAIERAAKERKKEELEKEATAVAALRSMLTHAQTTLTGLRDNLPGGPAYAAIWTEARNGVQALATFNANVAPTAKSETLQAKLDEVNKLISKVRNFEPPETPQQRRDRKFAEMTTNVPLRMDQGQWTGPFGPEVDFTVDKHDNALWQRLRNHFGRDTVVVPNHDRHDYPHKTATSEVRYYLTGKSHTPSIAYDISLHVFDKNDAGQWVKVPYDANHDAVYVLHIPHKPN